MFMLVHQTTDIFGLRKPDIPNKSRLNNDAMHVLSRALNPIFKEFQDDPSCAKITDD
jgi:hypothetical protein